MKKLFAMMLVICMLLTGLTAMAEDDANTLKIAVIGPFTGGAAIYGLACRYRRDQRSGRPADPPDLRGRRA